MALGGFAHNDSVEEDVEPLVRRLGRARNDQRGPASAQPREHTLAGAFNEQKAQLVVPLGEVELAHAVSGVGPGSESRGVSDPLRAHEQLGSGQLRNVASMASPCVFSRLQR